MKKSINVFVAVFMVMSVVLTACQPAAGTVTTKEVVVTQLVEKVFEKIVLYWKRLRHDTFYSRLHVVVFF